MTRDEYIELGYRRALGDFRKVLIESVPINQKTIQRIDEEISRLVVGAKEREKQ